MGLADLPILPPSPFKESMAVGVPCQVELSPKITNITLEVSITYNVLLKQIDRWECIDNAYDIIWKVTKAAALATLTVAAVPALITATVLAGAVIIYIIAQKIGTPQFLHQVKVMQIEDLLFQGHFYNFCAAKVKKFYTFTSPVLVQVALGVGVGVLIVGVTHWAVRRKLNKLKSIKLIYDTFNHNPQFYEILSEKTEGFPINKCMKHLQNLSFLSEIQDLMFAQLRRTITHHRLSISLQGIVQQV